MQCSAVDYDVVQYSFIVYCSPKLPIRPEPQDVVCYNTAYHSTVQCSAAQYSTVLCSSIQYGAVQFDALYWDSVVRWSAVQCSAARRASILKVVDFISSVHLSWFRPQHSRCKHWRHQLKLFLKIDEPCYSKCIVERDEHGKIALSLTKSTFYHP